MKTTELLNELEKTTSDFIDAISLFKTSQINIVPFDGSWTAGQVVEHILKSETNLPEVLLGDTAPTERPADQNAPVIDGIFLDFSTKLQSPEFIIPSNGPHDQEELLNAFKKERDEISKVASTEDLSLTCTSSSFPGMGELTRYEWINFINRHSKRHTHQLLNIFEKVSEKVDG